METMTTTPQFTIVVTERKNEYSEHKSFKALDNDGKEIFGAYADLSREAGMYGVVGWTAWRINYGSCGSDTHEGKLPHVAAINAAMEAMAQS